MSLKQSCPKKLCFFEELMSFNNKESGRAQGKEIPPHLRLLKTEEGRQERYSPSTTEEILEEICASFGTELKEAYIDSVNGVKLVRVSQPVVLTNQQTDKKCLLQCQYTRFSPLFHHKTLDIYNEEKKSEKRLGIEELLAEAKKITQGIYSPHLEVTKSDYLPVHLHRWKKELYFSVFNLEDKEIMPGKLKPFLIHEGGSFEEKVPSLHIRFNIEPYFVIGNLEKDTTNIYDEITFSYPQTSKSHDLNINQALSLCPLDKLNPELFSSSRSTLKDPPFKKEYEARFLETYKVPSLIPRTITMGFINSFLKSECLGRRF